MSNDPSEFFDIARDWPIAPQPPSVNWRARAERLDAQLAEVRAVAQEILCDDRVAGAPWLERLSAALRVEGPEG